MNLAAIQTTQMSLRNCVFTPVQDLLAHTLTTKNEAARIVGEFWQQFASLSGSY